MAEEEDFAATVRKRIEAGRQRRDRDHLLAVYQRFLGPGTSTDVGEEREQGNEDASRKTIMMASLAQALNELHVGPSNGETMEEICLAFDTNRDGLIDFNEFVAATLRPSHADAWCKQLSLWRAIADAIPPVAHCDQPLRAVALLTDAQIDVICTEALKSIKSELRTKVLELSNAMKRIEETTKALAGKFMQAMDLEHCKSYGHDISFTTPNYQITTTPQTEWGIVVLGEQPSMEHMDHGRKIVKLALADHWARDDLELHENLVLVREKDDPNGAGEKRMREARMLITEARLQRSEVAAVILYTGPMVRPQLIA